MTSKPKTLRWDLPEDKITPGRGSLYDDDEQVLRQIKEERTRIFIRELPSPPRRDRQIPSFLKITFNGSSSKSSADSPKTKETREHGGGAVEDNPKASSKKD